MRDIAIYGFGGFGREVACLIKQMNQIKPELNLIGFFDDGVAAGKQNRYGKVLGNIHDLNEYKKQLNIILAIANPDHLKNISNNIKNPLIAFPNIIAPNTNIFDPEAFSIGRGNLIFLGCRLSCDVSIGNFNIFNGAVSLGHDVSLGSYNVLGPSVRISGDCSVGDNNFFGVNSVVLQGHKIGNNTRIGAGSMVIKNTRDDFLYLGNPAKRIIQ